MLRLSVEFVTAAIEARMVRAFAAKADGMQHPWSYALSDAPRMAALENPAINDILRFMTAHEPITVPHRAKLRVADFLLLAESGAFRDYARTELIEGEIWAVNSVHSRHARTHAILGGELWAALKTIEPPLLLYTAPSTELSEETLPEPDIAIADPNDARLLPGAAVRIAIEISDSTLDIDLGRKLRLYARAAVPEYWVVDIEGRTIHQMWAPTGEEYAERRKIAFGEALAAATIIGLTITTDGL